MGEIELMRQEKLQNQKKLRDLRDQLDESVCTDLIVYHNDLIFNEF